MSQDHRLQQQRFELKYLINEDLTEQMRSFVSAYLEPDEYGIGKPGQAYPVHSVYLDSDDLATHQWTINGTKNRFKLRLRYYDEKPTTPVFFEVKARVDNCILKQRCGVRREAVPILLAGQLPEPDHLLSKEPRHLVALHRFNFLMVKLNARPKVHNSYRREAWVSASDNSVRVTFDRCIRIEPHFKPEAVIAHFNPIRVFPEFTVLELKFTTRFPNWLRDLVRTFNLMQFSSAKYSEGVVVLGEYQFHNGDRALVTGECLPPPVPEALPTINFAGAGD
jgi:SPX domain protein involved in polyphosphate accumulation